MPLGYDAMRPSLATIIRSRFSLTWTDGVVENSGGTTITYSSRALGSPHARRRIIVFASARMTTVNTITGVTVAGIAATAVSGTAAQQGGTNGSNCQIWQADVPTGTTGDIAVTYGAATSRTGISVYRLITANSAAISSNQTSQASGTSLSASLTVPANGAGIAGIMLNSVSSAIAPSNCTEDFEATATGPSEIWSGSTTVVGAVTPGGTFSSAAGSYSCAAWGP